MHPFIAVKLTFARHLTATRTFILSFISIILLGALLLWLPSSAAQSRLSFTDALFTSASAVCVTGLATIDIGKDLSTSGQTIEAQIGKPLTNEQRPYQVVNGVAVISATGVIAKRMDLFMQISGGISTEKISADLKIALADPRVLSIVLVLDSPGGTIDGIFELADLVYESRAAKNIYSLAYGTMASAAYLIGAAASEVYASDVAAAVGSIGIIAIHEDTSAEDQRSGVVTTRIYRGKYKGLVSDGPLTDEARMTIEEKVDYYYSLFIIRLNDLFICSA